MQVTPPVKHHTHLPDPPWQSGEGASVPLPLPCQQCWESKWQRRHLSGLHPLLMHPLPQLLHLRANAPPLLHAHYYCTPNLPHLSR